MTAKQTHLIKRAELAASILRGLDRNATPLRLYFLETQGARVGDGPVTFQPIDHDWFAGEIADQVIADLTVDGRHECEACGGIFGGDHYSAADCNQTGRGVTLCRDCAERQAAEVANPRDQLLG